MSNPLEEISISSIQSFDRKTANGALLPQRNTVNVALMGRPRGTYGKDCEEPDNPAFNALLETADVGPFKARGLRPAVRALAAIFRDVQAEAPEIYGLLGNAGMLCCRLVRGSATAVSNHSWGTAIDLTLGGKLDTWNDNKVQRGLLDLWPIFNRHEFYWGIAFGREDAMHFEASEQLIRKWAKAGEFGPLSGATITRALTIGDRGPQVQALQVALNRALAPSLIAEDGIFGPMTRLAVIAFQRKAGLVLDGLGSGTVLKRLEEMA
ncbi:MAG: M15 family metallopeptidase [bacterium]|jgi:hypothetical protein